MSNDPIRQWWEDVSDQFVWDLLPWEFLYECYKHWFEVNNRSGRVQSKRTFLDRMRKIAEDDKIWEYPGKGKDGKDKQLSAVGRIVDPEPLARDYYLPNTDMRDDFKDYRRLSRPELWQGNQRGLLRRNPRQMPGQVPGSVPGPAPSPASDDGIMGPAPGSVPGSDSDYCMGPAPGSVPGPVSDGIPA